MTCPEWFENCLPSPKPTGPALLGFDGEKLVWIPSTGAGLTLQTGPNHEIAFVNFCNAVAACAVPLPGAPLKKAPKPK